MSEVTKIRPVKARETVEIHLSDGRVYEGPRYATVEAFFKNLPEWQDPPILGAVINGDLRELTHQIKMDANVKLVTMADADGMRIYRRSLTFLVEAVFEELFSDAALSVDHSVSSGGYYCTVSGYDNLTEDDINRIEERMKDMVAQDLPFSRREVPLDEAIEIFSKRKQDDKVSLMKTRAKAHLVLYSLLDHQDYHHGYMVPSTGYLKWFNLVKLGDGFVLQFPRRHAPNEILPLPFSQRLLSTFQQYGSWLDKIGVPNVGALNEAIRKKRIREVILLSEALHEQKIAEIATGIARNPKQPRIVLIAGPSSSGKTTFSRRLSIQLMANGLYPFPVEMDNFFVARDLTPKDENGEFDFESIDALDRELLSEKLKALISGKKVQLPRFNFRSGKPEKGDVVQLRSDQVIVLEGIHGLNPHLLKEISPDQTFRIYVSDLTQLNLDRHNRISTTDTRLIRRIVRDARERGYSAQDTINRWESVRRGEKRHIFPYQDQADEMFNSALGYELSALKSLAVPILRQVPHGTKEFIEAKRLLTLLEWFLPIDIDQIPDNSILREFIGNSILKGLHFV
ncbi:MAG: nucleoside kinase [Anaerolineaceae bacterium]|nr:nucleoside kinase [Anaerolineaceae bacterium]